MTTRQAKARGFDLSSKERGDKYVRIRCSQCEALVINGVPCHERGCPNKTGTTHDEED